MLEKNFLFKRYAWPVAYPRWDHLAAGYVTDNQSSVRAASATQARNYREISAKNTPILIILLNYFYMLPCTKKISHQARNVSRQAL
jgi:hypothetical protein